MLDAQGGGRAGVSIHRRHKLLIMKFWLHRSIHALLLAPSQPQSRRRRALFPLILPHPISAVSAKPQLLRMHQTDHGSQRMPRCCDAASVGWGALTSLSSLQEFFYSQFPTPNFTSLLSWTCLQATKGCKPRGSEGSRQKHELYSQGPMGQIVPEACGGA
jgi:hypothetical protein